LSRQFLNGLSLRDAYTFSHSLDNTPQELESNSGAPPDGRNYKAWYGNSDFDIPHRVALTYVYDLPFGRGRHFVRDGVLSYVFSGFRTSGVYTFYSGHPFTVNEGGARNSALDAFGQATAVPNVVGTTRIVGSPDCWFYASVNKACQTLAPGLSDSFVLLPAGAQTSAGFLFGAGLQFRASANSDALAQALDRHSRACRAIRAGNIGVRRQSGVRRALLLQACLSFPSRLHFRS